MQKLHNTWWFSASMILSTVLIVAYATLSFAGSGNKVAGSYLLRQDDGFMQILTLTKKGTALSQNNGQYIGENQFGNQQGEWQNAKGTRKFAIRTLDFTFDTVTDEFTGFGLSTFDVEFDKGFDTLSGTVLVEIFGPDQDPLDSQAVPIQTLGPHTFTGSRISAQ
jgi:hypothetical protein